MGPRLFSRGKRPGAPVILEVLPSFNGAATVQPRKDTSGPAALVARSSLQWGRDCSAAERQILQVCKEEFYHASMGPRLFSRGKRWLLLDLGRRSSGFNGAATVQPRKVSWAAGL